MHPTKKALIRGNYIASQWATVFCAFGGTLLSLYDYQHPDTRKPENTEDYIWTFGISIIAATIAAYTANKFQSKKIGANVNNYNEYPKYPYHLAPRNWRSNLAESAYLTFATTLLLVNNYFLLAAIKAQISAFRHPDRIYPLLPLSTFGFILLAVKTIGIDLIFNTTNAHYEAAEEIKNDITRSKAGSLVSQLCKPFASHLLFSSTLFWINSIGVLSHTLTDYLGLLLSIPPTWFIQLAKTPVFFYSTLSIFIGISIPLLLVNCIQTYYFEAKESEINLTRIKKIDPLFKQYPELAPPENKSNVLRTLLTRAPSLKQPICFGFFTQAPLHAFGDAMPVILFLRDILDRFEIHQTSIAAAIIIPLASYIFISSTYGTYESEVKTAIHHSGLTHSYAV